MKRLLALLSALILVMVLAPTALAGKAHPASGPNPGFSFNSGWGVDGGWIDNTCTGSQAWQIVLYQDVSYGGWHTKICSNQSNFCEVPMSGTGNSDAYCIGAYHFASANDEISSLQWRGFNGPVCLVVHSDSDYRGFRTFLGASTTGAISNMGNTSVGNDYASSLNATSLDKC